MRFCNFKSIVYRFSLTVKRKGIGFLPVVIITALLIGILSYGVVRLNGVTLKGLNSFIVVYKAQQYAEAEASVLKAIHYNDLVAKNKTFINNASEYYYEILVSNENNYSDSIKQRVATINIYYENNNLPCYSLKVLKTSAVSADTVNAIPVGTIIPWDGSAAPAEGGTWLLCNGGTFSASTYPILYSVLGKSTLPSLNGRFLEGTTSTPGITKEAGLPNITGTLKSTSGGNQFSDITSSTISYSGAIIPVYGSSYNMENRAANTLLMGFTFNASKSNNIYGKSLTVQPSSYLVRYYIKAS